MTAAETLAIVGATGLVGNELVVLLDQRAHSFAEVRLLASKESEGEVYKVGEDEVPVHELNADSFAGVKLAVFTTQPDVAAKFIPIAIAAGARVIDCSGAMQSDRAVPLILPEVNAHLLRHGARQVAAPCPAVVQLAPVLKIIHEAAGLRRVHVTALESVSGAGKSALDELWDQTLSVFNQKPIESEQLEHQIAFSCIPQVGPFTDDGSTLEERRIVSETQRVLGLPELAISVTAVRVPVLYGQAQVVHVECDRSLAPESLIALISEQAGIEVAAQNSDYPMPLASTGTDEIHVGRVRRDPALQNGLAFWVVADNIRRGAALNALRLVELLGEPFSD